MMYRNSSYADKQFDYYLYEKDVFGNIIAIYNASGTKVASYCYDAWGNCTVLTNVNGVGTMNPFRYRGYYLDTETNLYYLQSRYYDSYVGRFINADDSDYLGEGENELLSYNLFSYCANNPVMYIDPEGTWGWKDIFQTALIVTGIVALTVAATAAVILTAGVAAPALAAVGVGIVSTSAATALVTSVGLTATIVAGISIGSAFLLDTVDDQLTFSESYDPDPYKRPGQKKQNREKKEKKKKDRKKWNPNPNKRVKPPKHHTPSRDHRKFK